MGLHISSQKNINKIIIFNSAGTKIIEQSVNQMFMTINTNWFSNGIYFVNIVAMDGTTGVSKIIIQK